MVAGRRAGRARVFRGARELVARRLARPGPARSGRGAPRGLVRRREREAPDAGCPGAQRLREWAAVGRTEGRDEAPAAARPAVCGADPPPPLGPGVGRSAGRPRAGAQAGPTPVSAALVQITVVNKRLTAVQSLTQSENWTTNLQPRVEEVLLSER